MNQDREQLIDFLLGEVSGEQARALSERLATDAEAARALERYREALGLLRHAATTEWTLPRRRTRWLRPAIAAAAVLAVALTLYWVDGGEIGRRRIFDPDGATGYLRAEETDQAGHAVDRSEVDACTLRSGSLEVSVLGSERAYRVRVGDIIPPDSELRSLAETGVRLDLPHGGILFLGPISTVQLRRRRDGESALRLTLGVACAVAGRRPIHLAVDGTELLLRQESGASFLRFSPPEAVCLRGRIQLRYDRGKLFRIPEGERLPAACSNDPRTVPVTDDELALDWYRDIVYRHYRVERIAWERPGRSRPLRTGPKTLLYLRLVPHASGHVSVRFGDAGAARRYPVRKGVTLELRLRFSDLGPGNRLEITPAAAVREARLFDLER